MCLKCTATEEILAGRHSGMSELNFRLPPDTPVCLNRITRPWSTLSTYHSGVSELNFRLPPDVTAASHPAFLLTTPVSRSQTSATWITHALPEARAGPPRLPPALPKAGALRVFPGEEPRCNQEISGVYINRNPPLPGPPLPGPGSLSWRQAVGCGAVEMHVRQTCSHPGAAKALCFPSSSARSPHVQWCEHGVF
ncbi:hypothetical protein CB1_000932070 [Camelus ferus]|nr:hypothetical protein CB1_000932070 [Camelus ferus]